MFANGRVGPHERVWGVGEHLQKNSVREQFDLLDDAIGIVCEWRDRSPVIVGASQAGRIEKSVGIKSDQWRAIGRWRQRRRNFPQRTLGDRGEVRVEGVQEKAARRPYRKTSCAGISASGQ